MKLLFWLNMLKSRGLIDHDHESELTELITTEKIKLNKFIKSIKSKI